MPIFRLMFVFWVSISRLSGTCLHTSACVSYLFISRYFLVTYAGAAAHLIDYLYYFVHSSFCARKSCSLRRYEYLVPAHLLQPAAATPASDTMTAAADDSGSSTAPFVSDQPSRSTLADCEQRFVGEHWFHNYTTPSERSKTRTFQVPVCMHVCVSVVF